MIERLKLQIEIIKTKLLFFVGVVGAVGFIATHFESFKQVVPLWIIWIGLIVLLLYGVVGIDYNIGKLTQKYEELEDG